MTMTLTQLALNPHGWRPTEDEPFRWDSQMLDEENGRDLLKSIVAGDVLFLDDPRSGGEIVGYVLRGCENVLCANLNLGLEENHSEPGGGPGEWLAHDHLDWFLLPDGKPTGNLLTLLDYLADGKLEALIDCGAGGIVAYVLHDRIAEVQRVLNRTGDPHGVFGKISQLGDIYPTAEWGGEGPKPKATHWYWSTGNVWCAVVEDWEKDSWWIGVDPADISARPDPWFLPIWQLPSYGTLSFNVAEHIHQELLLPGGDGHPRSFDIDDGQVNQEGEPMTKMIEVPEEHLLGLKKWHDGKSRSFPLIDHINALIACLPKPIEVGSRVRMAGGVTDGTTDGTVIAINDDKAWVLLDGNVHYTLRMDRLEVIE